MVFYGTNAQDQDKDPQAVIDHINMVNKALRNNDRTKLNKLIHITKTTPPDDLSQNPVQSTDAAIAQLRKLSSTEVTIWSAYPIEGSSPKHLQGTLNYGGLKFWIVHVESNSSSPSGWTIIYLAPRKIKLSNPFSLNEPTM